ncbi:MAG: DUF5054 domain-containing protein [Devosia sp.]
MAGKVIHLVFKTHLDIGFTDHAEKVRAQYHQRFIPQAIETAEHFRRENPERPAFIWTTGAWLIWDHLNSQRPEAVSRLEEAIGRGLIRWHALPFTTHSELMSPALFRAGLSFSEELDRRFGKATIAGKMTDVPGHTRGIVPLLAEAGVKFLHIGVNTASPPPDVPDVFRWRAPMGEEVVVMYQKSYGATHFPEGFDQGLSFAHTSDNMGPQSVPQTADVYREMARHFPDAEIRAATLEEYGALLWARRDEFPVIDLELGDSWIHGSASDPAKTARFLALQRLYDRFAAEGLTPERQAFGRGLTMVAEHTCGVDIKSYLRDETAWDRTDFEAARQKDYRFAYTEASWMEQRGYLDAAVAELGPDDRVLAEAALAELRPGAEMDAGGIEEVIAFAGWTVRCDPPTGDLLEIATPGGARLSGASLMGYRYESYDAKDVEAYLHSYLTHRAEWAILDHAKPGLGSSKTAVSQVWVPRLAGVARSARGVTLAMEMPEQANRRLGAPRRLELALAARDARTLELALIARGKPANRMPEASFLHFAPEDIAGWEFRKMGLWQKGDRVASNGGGQLQAVAAVRATGLELTPLDTPLVGPAGWPFMTYCKGAPDFGAGLRFCLHNNKWGTNFPQWWGGDLAARFVLRLG